MRANSREIMSEVLKEELKIFCTSCKQKMDVSEFSSFAVFPCPVCKSEILVPKKLGKHLANKQLPDDDSFENYLGIEDIKKISIKVFKKTVSGSLGIKACLKMLAKEQPDYKFTEFKGRLIGICDDSKIIDKLESEKKTTEKTKSSATKSKTSSNTKVTSSKKPPEAKKALVKSIKIKRHSQSAYSHYIIAGLVAGVALISFVILSAETKKKQSFTKVAQKEKSIYTKAMGVSKQAHSQNKTLTKVAEVQRKRDIEKQEELEKIAEVQRKKDIEKQEELEKTAEVQRKRELEEFLLLINPPEEKLKTFASLPKISSIHFNTLMTKHCTECHNAKKNKGDLDLNIFSSDISLYRSYEVIKQSYENVVHGDMPPDEDDISSEDKTHLISYFEKLIHTLESKPLNFKKSALIRRLTPYEYDNTIADITGLDLNIGDSFPADGGGNQGFTNDAYVMGVSPILMEKYIEAAELISGYSQFDINKGIFFNRTEESLLPAEVFETSLRKKMHSAKSYYPVNFKIENSLSKIMKAVAELYFKTGKKDSLEVISKRYEIHQSFIQKAYKYFTSSARKSDIELKALKPWKKLKRGNVEEKDLNEAISHFTEMFKTSKAFLHSRTHKERKKHISIIKNIENIFTLNEKEAAEEFQESQYLDYKRALNFYNFSLFASNPRDGKDIYPTIKTHIRKFLYKVYRRPPTEYELEIRTKDFLNDSINYGVPAAARILVIREFSSVNFAFRIERKRSLDINDYDLASRLSYFLWAGPPDEELLSLASKGELKKEKTLLKQVDRMLKDKKSARLAKHFANQWLKFGEILTTAGPDSELFSNFDPQLAKDMWQETAMCFNYIVKNDRSILEIIDSDYTIINNRLSRIYGLTQSSPSFKKVTVDRAKRGGVLGHASFLTMSSLPKRTSPIIRGNWVLTVLLGITIPPPPMDVPDLPEEEIVNESFTLEQQLAKHRDIAACRGCHKKIDPLGIVLENYDPIGRWRGEYHNAPIISKAKLGGIVIEGPQGLKKYILENKIQFIRNLSRKMVSYSLGRSIYFYDNYLINQMIENSIRNNYKFSSLVKTIVLSPQFQHK